MVLPPSGNTLSAGGGWLFWVCAKNDVVEVKRYVLSMLNAKISNKNEYRHWNLVD